MDTRIRGRFTARAIACAATGAMSLLAGGAGALAAQDQQPAAAPPAAAPAEPVRDTTNLPPARQVIDKYIKAIGGEAAIRSKTSRHVKGSVTFSGADDKGTIEIWSAAPSKYLFELDYPGAGPARRGYDGKTGWQINQATGPQTLGGKQLDELREQASFYVVLHEPKDVPTIETVAREEFANKPCYTVRTVTGTGREVLEHFDIDSGLLIGTTTKRSFGDNDIDWVTTMSDYRATDGVQMPMSVSQRGMGVEVKFVFDTVEYDNVAPSVFDLPPEIRAMVVDQPKLPRPQPQTGQKDAPKGGGQ